MRPLPTYHKPESHMSRIMKQKESEVVKSCLQWLQLHGCFAWRNNTGEHKTEAGHYVKYGKVGSADILGVAPNGRFLAVECKAPGNKLKPHQEEFRDSVLKKNGLFILATSIDDLSPVLGEMVTVHYPTRFASGVVPSVTARPHA